MNLDKATLHRNRQALNAMMVATAFAVLVAMPQFALAQSVDGAAGSVRTFFSSLNTLLNVASIAIVTIAIIFAGYQIAFNHKRIGDVAPVLIGGFLIGAAAQIANMLLPDEVGAEPGGGAGGMAMAFVQLLQYA
ncbi:TrbC/VirB2 family protein [Luteimonas huabeiensis]|uniref:TrbC/VirB2 family protein n=1 Tax=Luteimonas huabeiensis TaxID=1244513 RepID=UPI0004637BE9|nr:TrbC/VirB2 family protein [Luteimonas huabeiensis]